MSENTDIVTTASTELENTTLCTYKITEEDGSTHLCGKKAVSPTYPYCYKHLRAMNSPVQRHRRYEDTMPDMVKDQYEHQLEDDKSTDLDPELAQLRALLNVHFDKIRTTISPEGKIEMTAKDFAVILTITDQIRKTAEVQSRINPSEFILRSDVDQIIKDVISIINVAIPNDLVQLRQRIVNNLQKYAMTELIEKISGPNTKSKKSSNS